MIRIAVFGNSHAAALKSAWDRIGRDHAGIRMVFFAARGDKLADLEARDGRLVPRTAALEASLVHTSGGLATVDPDQYDVHLVCALGLRPLDLSLDRYSEAVILQAVEDAALASLNHRIARMVRSVTAAPIYTIPNPLSAVQPNSAEVEPAVLAMSHRGIARAYAPLGATLVPQPNSTITRGFYTKRKFSTGSTRLDIGDSISGNAHPRWDRVHMNADYGALVLTEALGQVARSGAGRVPGEAAVRRLIGWARSLASGRSPA